jgi:mxaJ protein
VRGYLVYGDYSTPNPPRRVIDAVSSGQVDTAIAWGPLAGYFAKQSTVPLEVTPVGPHRDGPALPFEFDIAMGVRRGDNALHDALDRVLARRAAQIRQILERFGVPLLGQP